jgi:hypothetical protein
VFAHGNAGLTGTNDQGIDFNFLKRPVCALLQRGLIQVGHGLPPLIPIIVVLLLRLYVVVMAAFCSEAGIREIMIFVVAG